MSDPNNISTLASYLKITDEEFAALHKGDNNAKKETLLSLLDLPYLPDNKKELIKQVKLTLNLLLGADDLIEPVSAEQIQTCLDYQQTLQQKAVKKGVVSKREGTHGELDHIKVDRMIKQKYIALLGYKNQIARSNPKEFIRVEGNRDDMGTKQKLIGYSIYHPDRIPTHLLSEVYQYVTGNSPARHPYKREALLRQRICQVDTTTSPRQANIDHLKRFLIQSAPHQYGDNQLTDRIVELPSGKLLRTFSLPDPYPRAEKHLRQYQRVDIGYELLNGPDALASTDSEVIATSYQQLARYRAIIARLEPLVTTERLANIYATRPDGSAYTSYQTLIQTLQDYFQGHKTDADQKILDQLARLDRKNAQIDTSILESLIRLAYLGIENSQSISATILKQHSPS